MAHRDGHADLMRALATGRDALLTACRLLGREFKK